MFEAYFNIYFLQFDTLTSRKLHASTVWDINQVPEGREDLKRSTKSFKESGKFFCGTYPLQIQSTISTVHLPPWWVRSFPSQLPNPQALVSGKSCFLTLPETNGARAPVVD